MSIHQCILCELDPKSKARYGDSGLADGVICPSCNRPTCRNHLTNAYFKWKATGQRDSTQVCKDCVRSYAHRHWDSYNRDWLT